MMCAEQDWKKPTVELTTNFSQESEDEETAGKYLDLKRNAGKFPYCNFFKTGKATQNPPF